MPLDGVVPVDDDELEQPALPASVSSVGNLSTNERLLALEINVTQLRHDSAVMRRSSHRVENEMQKFVALEAQCVTSLGNINANLSSLTSIVNSLNATKVYADGVVTTIIKVGTFLLGAALIMGALSGKIHFTL